MIYTLSLPYSLRAHSFSEEIRTDTCFVSFEGQATNMRVGMDVVESGETAAEPSTAPSACRPMARSKGTRERQQIIRDDERCLFPLLSI